MNVCGGHERSISAAGIRGALPTAIELIPGPGCPVCICPEEDVYQAIQLALKQDIILLAFGDMLRVPVNVPKGEARSLEQAKAAGADVVVLAVKPQRMAEAAAAIERSLCQWRAERADIRTSMPCSTWAASEVSIRSVLSHCGRIFSNARGFRWWTAGT